MGEAQEMYEHAMQQTGLDDPAEALDALIDSYGKEEYEYEDSCDEDIETEYSVGNTVRLQSGSPLMTIKEINNNILTCRWFDNHKIFSELFSESEIYLDGENQRISTQHYQDINIQKQSVPTIDIDEDEIPF